ncbi:hypothetical protein GCM10009608_24910 [Pseudonocardia alaniniphila]
MSSYRPPDVSRADSRVEFGPTHGWSSGDSQAGSGRIARIRADPRTSAGAAREQDSGGSWTSAGAAREQGWAARGPVLRGGPVGLGGSRTGAGRLAGGIGRLAGGAGGSPGCRRTGGSRPIWDPIIALSAM